jgi:hypothetical protein
LPAEVGGKHLYLPDFIRQGKEGHHGFVETAPQEFRLFPGEKILQKHEKLRVPPFHPMEQNPGIMKNHINTGKFIERRNERLYFFAIESFKLILTQPGGKVAGNPQYKSDFIHGFIYLTYFRLLFYS